MGVSTIAFVEPFDTVNTDFWYVSDFVMSESWIHNTWSDDNVTTQNGVVELELNTEDNDGKPFTGAEIQTLSRYGYGRYEVTMQASGEEGVNSSFFTYTGPYFGDKWNEIDFEFLGKDPTKVSLGYHYDGKSVVKWVDLGFDASKSMNDYAFEWEPDTIRWYANDTLIYEAKNESVPIPDTPSKLYMNIWTGINGWLGTPDFKTATSALYSEVSFTPYDPSGSGGPTDPGDDDGKGDGDDDGTKGDGGDGNDDNGDTGDNGDGGTGTGGNTNDDGGPNDDGGAVEGLSIRLVDAATDKTLGDLSDGMTIGGDEPWSVVVSAKGALGKEVKSVSFALHDASGEEVHTKTENYAPYAMFGDSGGDIFAEPVADGDYTLTLTGFDARRGSGSEVFQSQIDITVAQGVDDGDAGNPTTPPDDQGTGDGGPTDGEGDGEGDGGDGPTDGGGDGGNAGASGDSAISLFLVNADTSKVVGELLDGDTIDLAALGIEELSVLARVDDPKDVDSIAFDLDGAVSVERTESYEPYALFGDHAGDFKGRVFEAGSYTLTASAYEDNGARGGRVDLLELDFTIL